MNQMTLAEMVSALVAHFGTPAKVAEHLDGRASARSVYRWKTGSTTTRNVEVVRYIRALLEKVQAETGAIPGAAAGDDPAGDVATTQG